jgi:hypothetical protein
MKTKLEEMLASAKPTITQGGGFQSVEEVMDFYLKDGHAILTDVHARVLTTPSSPSRAAASWGWLTVYLTTLLRAQSDGYNPLEMLGFTKEEATAMVASFQRLRDACAGYKKANPTSPSAQLYAKVRELGF